MWESHHSPNQSDFYWRGWSGWLYWHLAWQGSPHHHETKCLPRLIRHVNVTVNVRKRLKVRKSWQVWWPNGLRRRLKQPKTESVRPAIRIKWWSSRVKWWSIRIKWAELRRWPNDEWFEAFIKRWLLIAQGSGPMPRSIGNTRRNQKIIR